MKTDTTTKPPEAPVSERVGDCSATSCSLKLSASGTPHQLIAYLRNAADQIEMDSKRHPLPWFNVVTGAMMADFKVSPANVEAQGMETCDQP